MNNPLSTPQVQTLHFPPFPSLVRPAYRFFDMDGQLWVGYANNWLRLRSSTPKINDILDLIDGSRLFDDIVTDAQKLVPSIRQDQVLRLLESLLKHGFLMSGDTHSVHALQGIDHYYDRHTRDQEFYSLFEQGTLSRFDYMQKLSKSRIVVLGLGGVGSWVTAALACMGAGTIVGADYDVVELSNLSRQIFFAPTDIGKSKVDATQLFLEEFSSGLCFTPHTVRVSSPTDLPPLIQGADCVILAADTPFRDIARWVNQVCWSMRVPSIYMSANLSQVWIGPMVVPNETSCRECYYRQNEISSEIQMLAQENWPADPMPALSPIPSFAGHMLAWEVLCHVTGIQQPESLGRALRLDLHTLEVNNFDVPVDPGCPVCQLAAESVANAD